MSEVEDSSSSSSLSGDNYSSEDGSQPTPPPIERPGGEMCYDSRLSKCQRNKKGKKGKGSGRSGGSKKTRCSGGGKEDEAEEKAAAEKAALKEQKAQIKAKRAEENKKLELALTSAMKKNSEKLKAAFYCGKRASICWQKTPDPQAKETQTSKKRQEGVYGSCGNDMCDPAGSTKRFRIRLSRHGIPLDEDLLKNREKKNEEEKQEAKKEELMARYVNKIPHNHEKILPNKFRLMQHKKVKGGAVELNWKKDPNIPVKINRTVMLRKNPNEPKCSS